MSGTAQLNDGVGERSRRARRWFWRLAWIGAAALATRSSATTYYVDAERGDDQASGTSVAAPWRSLRRAGRAPLLPGDGVKLAVGQSHPGQLRVTGAKGAADRPITIGGYAIPGAAPGARAHLDGRGTSAALRLLDCSFVTVYDLALSADGGGWAEAAGGQSEMRCGVLVEAAAPGDYEGIELRNLHVSRVSYHEPGYRRPAADVKTANGRACYGWGVRFMTRTATARMRRVAVRDCLIERVDHTGLKFTAPAGALRDVVVDGVRVLESGGPGVQLSGVTDGHFTRLHVDHSGSTADSRNWGRGSGLWTWDCRNIVIERSEFLNANGPGDSAGVHIDYRCRDVVVQYNFSANNAGGFCEILGDNHNCAYRYNVSVNDGRRVKGRDGAFQEGKTFWLSGYVGQGKALGPFNTYFYNNTIYLGDGSEARIAVAPTAEGVLIANNIFCLTGPGRRVVGDQFRVDPAGGGPLPRVVFLNNAFLRADNWPADIGLCDSAPLLGDPDFVRAGGLRPADYVPRNAALVKERGIRVAPLPDDPVGLRIGLEVTRDFFGNPVVGAPDLGAIEIP